jgi:FMN phosphatase YigB (HAD superfamily)
MRSVKTLAVFDLDNTLTDSLTFWATAIRPVAHTLAEGFGMGEERLVRTILAAPGQYRFSDIGHLITWLDERGELPRAHNPGEQHDIDMVKWSLRHNWYAAQKKMTVFYPGALDTLRALKAQGTAVALYTDTEASSMIRRLWLMAHNARRAGQIREEEDILGLFDQFYSQPSIDDDSRILRDVDLRFVQKIKTKMTLWTDGRYKPAPGCLDVIMKDFRTTPGRTVMVGDTHNDGGCAVPHRASFAWAHYGARIAPEIEASARRMASSHYKYGVGDIQAAFDATSRPDKILRESITEIFDHYRFVSGNEFTAYTGESEGSRRRKPGGQAAGKPPAHRLHGFSPSPTRIPPLGPATHFPPAP